MTALTLVTPVAKSTASSLPTMLAFMSSVSTELYLTSVCISPMLSTSCWRRVARFALSVYFRSAKSRDVQGRLFDLGRRPLRLFVGESSEFLGDAFEVEIHVAQL